MDDDEGVIYLSEQGQEAAQEDDFSYDEGEGM